MEKETVVTPLLFDDFPAAENLAKNLISNYHSDLVSARIKYICRNKAAKKGGKPVPGNIYKMAGKYTYLTDCDYVMEIALEVWNDFSQSQRLALTDHLLARCFGIEDEKTGEMRWKIRPPEVQEFSEIVERHGQWNESLVEIFQKV